MGKRLAFTDERDYREIAVVNLAKRGIKYEIDTDKFFFGENEITREEFEEMVDKEMEKSAIRSYRNGFSLEKYSTITIKFNNVADANRIMLWNSMSHGKTNEFSRTVWLRKQFDDEFAKRVKVAEKVYRLCKRKEIELPEEAKHINIETCPPELRQKNLLDLYRIFQESHILEQLGEDL